MTYTAKMMLRRIIARFVMDKDVSDAEYIQVSYIINTAYRNLT